MTRLKELIMSVPPPLATTGSIRLVPIPIGALRALLEGNLESASAIAGLSLTPYFVEHRWLWDIRVPQIEQDASAADWIARAAVDGEVVVGHVGFHGPPDGRSMVEVAYSVDPEHRRRGYGRAMLAVALAWAHAERVAIVRATIGPENGASLATVARFPFALVGEQWDEEDGRELVYELILDP
jgi:RimJ/RimL family protein N-acetyltransferase